ncbi:MAG: glycerophosphodiester phosphodiesterase family protein [Bacillota bacterium]
MKTIKIDKYFKGMVANRGLSGIETENTVFAYLAAANHSYNGISCDLLVTKDQKLILTAETSLLKYGLLNLDIQSFDYDELIKHNLVDRKSQNLSNFFFIPQLKNFLTICKAYEKNSFIKINPFLKNHVLDDMLTEIEDYYRQKNCFFIVENKKQIDRLISKSIDVSHIFYALKDTSQDNYEYCNKLKLNVYLDKTLVDKDYIKKLHLIGLKVITGVINDKSQAEKFIKYDIDFIFTNILE